MKAPTDFFQYFREEIGASTLVSHNCLVHTNMSCSAVNCA